MELKLKDAGQKITRIGRVRGHVILGPGIEIRFAALDWRGHALVFGLEVPPRLVVVFGRNLTGKDLPAPLVNEQSKGKKSNFVQLHFQQVTGIGALRRNGLQQAYLFQILRSHRESNGIADGLVEAIVGTVVKE